MTQVDLAAALGISRQSLRARLQGHRPFTVAELAAAAACFDLTVAELLERVEQDSEDAA